MADAPGPMDEAATSESRIVLQADGREFSVADVMRAAHFRGELDASWQSLLSKLACLQYAEEKALEPGSDKLQAIADQFRYEHDLITSEETEEWLAERGLDEDIFAAHVLRTYWRTELGERVKTPPKELVLTSDDSAPLVVQLILSGLLSHLTRDLANRLASLHTVDATGDALKSQVEIERARFFARAGFGPEGLAAWLHTIGEEEAWWEEMLRLEAACTLHMERVVTPEQLARALRTRRLGLMRFEAEEIEFETIEAAREAMLCVRDDHMSMEEVAAESGYSYRCHDFLLEEQPAAWQTTLLSTPEGSMATPFQDDGVFRLFFVIRKIEPSLEDPAARARLEEHLIDSAFEELRLAQGYQISA